MKEDEKITLIGSYVKDHPGKKVGVLVDDIPGTPERYVDKLLTQFAWVEIIESLKGPYNGMWTIIVKHKDFPLTKGN